MLSEHQHAITINQFNKIVDKFQFSTQSMSDDMSTDIILNANRRRNVRRLICTRQVTDLTNRLVSNDKDTVGIRVIIDNLQCGITELEKYDTILQDHMDEDAHLQDADECDDIITAIRIAIYKAKEYLESVKTSTNIKSEVKTSELNKIITSKSVHSKGVGVKPQFPNVIKQTTTSYTTDSNTSESSGLSSVKNNLHKEEPSTLDCSSINIISDKKQFHTNSYCCEICLTRDHQESQCVDVVSCEICNKQHHINYCPGQVSKMNGNNNLHNKISHNYNREINKTLNLQQGSETDVDTLHKVSSTEKITALSLTNPLQEVKAYLPMRTITDSSSQNNLIDKPVVSTLGPVSCDSINAPNSINKKDNLLEMEIVPFNTFFDNLTIFPDNVGKYFSFVGHLSGLIDTTISLNTTALRLVFNDPNGINKQVFDNLIFPDNVGKYFSIVVHLPGLTDTTTSINTTALRLVINVLNDINKQSFDNLKMFPVIVRKYFSIVVHSSGLVETTSLDVIVLHLTSNVSIIDVIVLHLTSISIIDVVILHLTSISILFDVTVLHLTSISILDVIVLHLTSISIILDVIVLHLTSNISILDVLVLHLTSISIIFDVLVSHLTSISIIFDVLVSHLTSHISILLDVITLCLASYCSKNNLSILLDVTVIYLISHVSILFDII